MFLWQARVYWEDTDGGGIVYHANYLRYLERCRSEWLRQAGFDQSALARQQGVVFAVVAASMRYLKPARLDDLLCIGCEPRAGAGVSMQFEQSIWRQNREGELLLTANVRIACLDAATLRPTRIPPEVSQRLFGSPLLEC